MAASPVSPPSQDDVSSISGFLQWAKDWGWTIVGSVGFPTAWHVSARLTKIEQRLEQHAEKFTDQVQTNKDLRDRMGELADKDDIKELRVDMRELRRGIETIVTGKPIP